MAKIILLLSRCFDEKKCCLFFVLISVCRNSHIHAVQCFTFIFSKFNWPLCPQYQYFIQLCRFPCNTNTTIGTVNYNGQRHSDLWLLCGGGGLVVTVFKEKVCSGERMKSSGTNKRRFPWVQPLIQITESNSVM